MTNDQNDKMIQKTNTKNLSHFGDLIKSQQAKLNQFNIGGLKHF
jgi:hypothetical protein